jgi:hypothetical protein
MKLRVYRWQSYRRECPGTHSQTEEICAAPSKAAVGRIVGTNPRVLFNLGETGNAESIMQAMSEPGVVFWQPINSRGDWRRA